MRAFVALLSACLPVAVALVAPFATPACVVPSPAENDAGSSSSASSGSGEDAGASAASVVGSGCTQLTASISLCASISSCPGLALNAQVFPQCGFRIHGTAIDPECVCGTALCPIGVPTTCAEAAAEASGDTTYDSVCEQSVEGSCLPLNAGSSGSGGSGASSGSGTSTACQQCIQNCDNVPSCIDACNC
jgi:hypothetical protein